MSHLKTAELRVLDLQSLQDAVVLLGGELVLDQKSFRSYVGKTACAHAIRIPHAPNVYGQTAYEIGVIPAQDGIGYELQFDNWGPGQVLEQHFGRDLTTLREEYGCSVAARALARKGYATQRSRNAAGELQLVAVKR